MSLIWLGRVKSYALRLLQKPDCAVCIMNPSLLQIYWKNGEDEEGFPKEGEQGSCSSFTDGGTATGKS